MSAIAESNGAERHSSDINNGDFEGILNLPPSNNFFLFEGQYYSKFLTVCSKFGRKYTTRLWLLRCWFFFAIRYFFRSFVSELREFWKLVCFHPIWSKLSILRSFNAKSVQTCLRFEQASSGQCSKKSFWFHFFRSFSFERILKNELCSTCWRTLVNFKSFGSSCHEELQAACFSHAPNITTSPNPRRFLSCKPTNFRTVFLRKKHVKINHFWGFSKIVRIFQVFHLDSFLLKYLQFRTTISEKLSTVKLSLDFS